MSEMKSEEGKVPEESAETLAEQETPDGNAGGEPSSEPEKASPKKKRSLKKIILYSVAGLVVLFVVMIFSLGAIVKAAVDNALPAITGTPCSLGLCVFNPISGSLTINNLEIGNPDGYGEKNAFELKHLRVAVEVGSLFSDTIVVDDITVEGMRVAMETKTLTETNLTDIKSNVDKVLKGEEKKEGEQKEESAEGGEEGEAAPGKKIIIRHIHFADNFVALGVGGHSAPIPMPDFTVEGVGEKEGGVEPVDAAIIILEDIIVNVSKTAGKATVDGVEKGASSLVNGVKSLFGGGKKDDKK